MSIDIFDTGDYEGYKNIKIVGINDNYVSFETDRGDFITVYRDPFEKFFKLKA